MQCEALEKVTNIARKNPKVLLSPSFFEKMASRLDIETEHKPPRMVFRYNDRSGVAVIIDSVNCQEYKCMVHEGKSGVRIFEFLKVLAELLTDEKIPEPGFDKMGQTAVYYCEQAIAILDRNILQTDLCRKG